MHSPTRGFWDELPRPIIGLAPMDGVTDSAFRFIMAKYGGPHPIYTEFTSVEGIRAGALRLLDDFEYDESERPVLAQLFGADPSAFFGAAAAAAALGFDGIDINMGCPTKNVTQHGAGAALILDPPRAVEIVRQARAGVSAWTEGRSLESMDLPEPITAAIRQRRQERGEPLRRVLPISLKTRLGYDRIVITQWVSQLLEAEPAAIALHGRTLKQGYTGAADWDSIAEGAAIIRAYGAVALGNGDITDLDDARLKIARYGVDGVLIGRAAFGNPWLFKATVADTETRRQIALEHARFLAHTVDGKGFVRIRKHLADYFRGTEGIKELRGNLMKVQTLADVETLLQRAQF